MIGPAPRPTTGSGRPPPAASSLRRTSQTNVVVELTEPVIVVRPLGRRAEATTIRFFTDTPDAVLNALRPFPHHSAS